MAWLRKFVLPPSVSGAAGLAVKPVGCRETFSIFSCAPKHTSFALWDGLGGDFKQKQRTWLSSPQA